MLILPFSSSDAQHETGLPPNWEVRHSNSKNLPYYFNSNDRNSRWEPPPGTDTEKLKVYMAKYHSPAGAGAANNGGGGADAGKIRAAHLLVKHSGSRRPSSWKEVRSWIESHPRGKKMWEELEQRKQSRDTNHRTGWRYHGRKKVRLSRPFC